MSIPAGASTTQLVTAGTGGPTPCPWEEVLPTITDVQPNDVRPGGELIVIASGGYLRDTCGAVNESARSYKIYFDDEPAGELSCYVNHCEGRFMLAPGTAVGHHCLGVQKGSCQTEVVVGEG